MKYLIAFVAIAGLITTGVSSQQPRGRGDHGCQQGGGPPPDPYMVLFDTDQDGRISSEEMDQSAVALKKLDRNQDGSLTREELPRPPRPDDERGRRDDRHGPPPGDRHGDRHGHRGDDRQDHRHADGPGHHEHHRGGRPDHRDDRRGPHSDRQRHDDRRQQGPPQNRPPRPERDRFQAPPEPAVSENVPAGTVIFTGGFETDPRDHGRPVNLIAAALGVEPQVFRDAFSRVQPARNGAPTAARARANKEVLMNALGKYGITNDRLDEVSNYYRYQPHNGEVWKRTPARATAIIKDGTVTGFKITSPGSGFTTTPHVTVAGHPELRVTATLKFSQDFQQNGSINTLTIE
ncbi:hypothetical protein [Gimesia panareensis]|uniref:hypothetical protein n=1 Tax=Gimesia panareensis TaxID=2527978 RepID=UPI0011888675|nr:hypothetical protein [Gimesia panareensis]QDU49179.1 EF hand [Gimesia panareensis]